MIGGKKVGDNEIGLTKEQYPSTEALKDHFCKPAVQDTLINWPQAVTVFKIKAMTEANGMAEANRDLKATLEARVRAHARAHALRTHARTHAQNWRGVIHKPNIEWVMKGNNGMAGTSGAAVNPGWGAGGTGLSRKVDSARARTCVHTHARMHGPSRLSRAMTPPHTSTCEFHISHGLVQHQP